MRKSQQEAALSEQEIKSGRKRQEETLPEADQQTKKNTVPLPPLQAELKPRRQPPPGKTAMQMIQGQWPGEETTEQLLAQLKALG